LRPSIRAKMAPALDLGLEELAGWGITVERRETPLDGHQGLVGNDMDLQSYEAGRPDCPSLTLGA
jgi:hydrogenase maturation protease